MQDVPVLLLTSFEECLLPCIEETSRDPVLSLWLWELVKGSISAAYLMGAADAKADKQFQVNTRNHA